MAAVAAAQEHGAAAGHEDHLLFGLSEMAWKWVNFAILAAGLGYAFVKMGVPFFRDRAAGIVKDIADATQTKQAAEAKAAELEKRISNLGAEIDQMRATAKNEMAAEGKRIQAETEAAVAKAGAQAEAEIASAVKAAKQELSAHAAALAVDLAAKKLSNNAGGAQGGLLDAFVRDLEKMKN